MFPSREDAHHHVRVSSVGLGVLRLEDVGVRHVTVSSRPVLAGGGGDRGGDEEREPEKAGEPGVRFSVQRRLHVRAHP